jgi:hypothetical protein
LLRVPTHCPSVRLSDENSRGKVQNVYGDSLAIYTHGNFDKALEAQRVYMDRLLKMKPATESTQ